MHELWQKAQIHNQRQLIKKNTLGWIKWSQIIKNDAIASTRMRETQLKRIVLKKWSKKIHAIYSSRQDCAVKHSSTQIQKQFWGFIYKVFKDFNTVEVDQYLTS